MKVAGGVEVAKLSPKIAGGEEKQRMTLKDYVTTGLLGLTPNIIRPIITANNFELKPQLISMV